MPKIIQFPGVGMSDVANKGTQKPAQVPAVWDSDLPNQKFAKRPGGDSSELKTIYQTGRIFDLPWVQQSIDARRVHFPTEFLATPQDLGDGTMILEYNVEGEGVSLKSDPSNAFIEEVLSKLPPLIDLVRNPELRFLQEMKNADRQYWDSILIGREEEFWNGAETLGVLPRELDMGLRQYDPALSYIHYGGLKFAFDTIDEVYPEQFDAIIEQLVDRVYTGAYIYMPVTDMQLVTIRDRHYLPLFMQMPVFDNMTPELFQRFSYNVPWVRFKASRPFYMRSGFPSFPYNCAFTHKIPKEELEWDQHGENNWRLFHT